MPLAAPVAGALELGRREGLRRDAAQNFLQQISAAEGAAPVVDDLQRRSRSFHAPHLGREHVQHGGMKRQALYDRGRAVARLARKLREEAAALLEGPVLKGADLDAADTECRQDMADVVAQSRREGEEHGPPGVDARVVVGEIRNAVQGHRRLTRAGGTADDDQAGRRAADQAELLRIDQSGDVRQVLVGALFRPEMRGPEAALLPLRGPVDLQGCALPARQARRLVLDALPLAGGVRLRDEDAFRCVDAGERAVADRDRAPCGDLSRTRAAGDVLLVLVALPVAVEDPRNGGVAPVDDRDAALDERALAETEIPLAAVFAQAQVPEVGAVEAHLRAVPRRLELAQERGLAVPLVAQRGPIGRVVAGQHLLAQPFELPHDSALGRRRAGRALRDGALHALEERQLVGDDRIMRLPPADCFRSPAWSVMIAGERSPVSSPVPMPRLRLNLLAFQRGKGRFQRGKGAGEAQAQRGLPAQSVAAPTRPGPSRAAPGPARSPDRPTTRGETACSPAPRPARRRGPAHCVLAGSRRSGPRRARPAPSA